MIQHFEKVLHLQKKKKKTDKKEDVTATLQKKKKRFRMWDLREVRTLCKIFT